MKGIARSIPLVVAALLVTGCGSTDGVGLERLASGTTDSADAPAGRSLPDWHPPLPGGHPPVLQGPMRLPPGHPAVPGAPGTCPGGGTVREPDVDRFRDFNADPHEVIRI
jgi:hypothetical protein